MAPLERKGGRFWARIAVPKDVQSALGKCELIEPLGGDRRAAERRHAGAVARLQEQIVAAKKLLEAPRHLAAQETQFNPISQDDVRRAVWSHYQRLVRDNEAKREAMPTSADVDAAFERVLQRIEKGELDASQSPFAMINATGEVELMQLSRQLDVNLRTRHLAALKSSFLEGETRLTDPVVEEYAVRNGVILARDSREWRELAYRFARAEIEALERTFEKDRGIFSGQPSDPILTPPPPRGSVAQNGLRSSFRLPWTGSSHALSLRCSRCGEAVQDRRPDL